MENLYLDKPGENMLDKFKYIGIYLLLLTSYIHLTEPKQQKKDSKFPIDGYIKVKYRIRWTDDFSPFSSDNTDQDIYEYLNIDFGDESRNRVTAHLYGRATQDLDGARDVKGFYIFDSITDTYKSSLNLRLYHAYIDINSFWIFSKMRVGRQYLYDTPEILYIDGGLVETKSIEKAGNLTFGIYGGLPTHLFESSVEGDVIFGLYSTWQFLPSNKMRVDWTYIRDVNFLGLNNNNLFGISFWQTIAKQYHIYLQSTILDSRWRDITIKGTYNNPDKNFWVSGYFKRLNETQKQLSIQFDPYFVVAQELFPYNQYQIDLYKGLGEHISISSGIMIRDLQDENKSNRFNREFRRFYITPAYHIKKPIMDISLILEWWDGAGTEDIKTAGLDITTTCSKKLKISIGTYYSLYKYDYYLDIERQNVRTYYLKAKYQLKDNIKIDGRFELENTQSLNIYTFDLGVRYDF